MHLVAPSIYTSFMTSSPRAGPCDVLCYGTISLDNIVRVPALPRSAQEIDAAGDYYTLGCGSLLVAAALGAWGLTVAVAGNGVGEDPYGDFIIRELARDPRVDTRGLEQEVRVRTPFRRIFVTPGGQHHIVRYWFDEARFVVPAPEIVRLARLFTLDVSDRDEHLAASRLAHQAGLPIILAGPPWPNHALASLADTVIVSGVGPDLSPPASAREHARRLRDAGAGAVIIRSGSTIVFGPDAEELEIPRFAREAPDPLGADDLFRAGIIFGRLRGQSLSESARFAEAAVALWAGKPAALRRVPPLLEIEDLLARPHQLTKVRRQSDRRPVCPLCRRLVDPFLFEQHWRLDEDVVRRLRAEFPAWRRVEGVCPTCVRPLVEDDPAASGRVPLDHPVYGQSEIRVWPTPVRLSATLHYTGRGVVVCFLDSGFYPHPDLTEPENRIVACVDASRETIVEPADFSVPARTSWHGLMTSVVAAGNGRLSGGQFRGIAPDARLVLVKVSDPRGRVKEPDILRGMRWVLDNHERYGIRIVNLSVGGDRPARSRSALNEAVDEAVRRGIVVVAAAGNTGTAELRPPASARGAITVGGLDDGNTLDRTLYRLYNSNWGITVEGDRKPEIVAPSIWLAAPVLPGTPEAEQILLLDRLWRADDEELPLLLETTYRILGFDPGLVRATREEQRDAIRARLVEKKVISSFYQHVDGTSFAAPIVSSVVAQMLEANPALTPEQVKALLVQTAEPLPNEPEDRQGYGVVSPGRAVAAALRERYGQLDDEPLSPYPVENAIRFVYHDPRAQHVSVIGDFNEWQPDALEMRERRPGVWYAELPHPGRGVYRYKFLVDRRRWLDDPENSLKSRDGYGGLSSILVIA